MTTREPTVVTAGESTGLQVAGLRHRLGERVLLGAVDLDVEPGSSARRTLRLGAGVLTEAMNGAKEVVI
ncbi:hypothetical protein [Streptomyces sp. NPDC048516]|uniref:hypothetical protein n=1 Tax=Streptomyces sp. NPDC048516 TaxID=3365565 RepID=UPI0037176FE9